MKIPYLPENNVKLCVAGSMIEKYKSELSKLGIRLLESQENNNLATPVKTHADLTVNYLGNGIVMLDKSQKSLYTSLSEIGCNCVYISEELSAEYPNDCYLNCLNNSEYIIGNYNYISNTLKEYTKGLKPLKVNQGYTKCSLCPVSENAFITDDISIYNSLNSVGYDALLVKKGSVRLNGYSYGFIGGASGKLSENLLAFFGNIKTHSDCENIISFCRSYNVDVLSLGNGCLEDIGSIIPICENM